MAISYSWKVTQMTKKTVGDNENVVLHVRWDLTGTDSSTGTSGKFSGATPLDFDSSSTDEFVAYGDLTEDLVIGWIQNIVVDSYWDHVVEKINEQIDAINDPEEEVKDDALPWSTGSADMSPIVTAEEAASGSVE
jgi:hypothetical protein